jgi:hypothetical protein
MSQQKHKTSLRHKKKKQLWPMIVLFGGGLLLLIGVVFAFNKPSQSKAAIEVSGSPSLKVDQEKVDLGDVKFNQPAEVIFVITNVGDKTLKFSKEPYVEILEGC